jgi:MFS family permease
VLALVSAQFMLAVVFYFFLFAATQLVRLTAPISLKTLTHGNAEALVGIAFTLGGLGSLAGVLFVARRWVVAGTFARTLAIGCGLAGAAHFLLAFSPNAIAFVAFFVLISLAEASILPACNTLIAANAPRARRGTAFGIAGSAQALAFMVGPMSAAAFAAISLEVGYLLIGLLFVALGMTLRLALREPGVEHDTVVRPAMKMPRILRKGRLAIRP